MADKKPNSNGECQVLEEYKVKRHSVKVFIDGGKRCFDLGIEDSLYNAVKSSTDTLKNGFWLHKNGKSTLFSPNRISEIEVVLID